MGLYDWTCLLLYCLSGTYVLLVLVACRFVIVEWVMSCEFTGGCVL